MIRAGVSQGVISSIVGTGFTISRRPYGARQWPEPAAVLVPRPAVTFRISSSRVTSDSSWWWLVPRCRFRFSVRISFLARSRIFGQRDGAVPGLLDAHVDVRRPCTFTVPAGTFRSGRCVRSSIRFPGATKRRDVQLLFPEVRYAADPREVVVRTLAETSWLSPCVGGSFSARWGAGSNGLRIYRARIRAIGNRRVPRGHRRS